MRSPSPEDRRTDEVGGIGSARDEVHVEYVGQASGESGVLGLPWTLAGVALAVLLGAAVIITLTAAYMRQSERVDQLESQNAQIVSDHETIGQQFANQSQQFKLEAKKLEQAVQSAYARGFRAGRQTADLPPSLRALSGLAAAGLLVPRQAPRPIDGRPKLEKGLDGYVVRWPRLAVFASRLEPVTNWTRQALGDPTSEKIGPYRVSRVIGPGGVIYAWRRTGVTYAVIAAPSEELLARTLISSMR